MKPEPKRWTVPEKEAAGAAQVRQRGAVVAAKPSPIVPSLTRFATRGTNFSNIPLKWNTNLMIFFFLWAGCNKICLRSNEVESDIF